MKFIKLSFFVLCVFLIHSLSLTGFAQSDDVAITVTAPPWMAFFLDDEAVFAEFEEEFGVRVVYIELAEDPYQINLGEETADYLTHLQAYVSAADVLFFDPFLFTQEATTAGYLLNLLPLAETDPDLDINDFYRSVWESFQWDGGLWALPTSVSLRFFAYNPDAFDAAGVQYPDASWTIDDFARAVRSLTVYDSEGNVETPGYIGGIDSTLIRAFTGQGFYDFNAIPNPPDLNRADIAEVLTTLQALSDEGILNNFDFQGDYQQIPLRIEGEYILSNDIFFGPPSEEGAEPPRIEGALFPGGSAGLSVTGYAVSAGTDNPVLAYELAKFLTQQPNMAFGGQPARRSQREQASEFGPQLDAEDLAFVEQALDNAIPLSEERYSNFVGRAAGEILNSEDGETADVAQVLEEIQLEAMTAYETALEVAETTVIDVAPAPPPVQLAEGEIELTLGLQLGGPAIPNREAWNQLIADFVAEEPRIGHVDLDTTPFNEAGLTGDCYVLDFNNLQNADLTTLINLDPFLDADPNFDPDGLIGDVIGQVQRDGQTWALPLYIRPLMLRYDPEQLEPAGAPLPGEDGWTTGTFVEALRAVDFFLEEDETPFFLGGNFELYMLMAAFGGSPFDYSASPPAVNFTDPSTVSAIQQVLDLAKEGLMNYFPLTPEYQDQGFFGFGGGGRGPAISTLRLYPFVFDQAEGQRFALTPFLRSSQVTPVSYDVGAAYISSDAQDPEACYRLLSRIAGRIDLLDGIPVRQSLLDDPLLEAAQGPQVAETYRQIAETIQQPNAVYFGFTNSSPSGFVESLWINRVFDDYVLGEAPINLEERLIDAEAKTIGFRACVEELTPFDVSAQDETYFEEYLTMVSNCGLSVDQDWVDPFGR